VKEMNMNTQNILLIITVLAFLDNNCLAKENSSFTVLSASPQSYFDPNSNIYSDWADHYKKNEAKLDQILGKCYECIEKRSNHNNGDGENLKPFIKA
jgi:hypothetical protein